MTGAGFLTGGTWCLDRNLVLPNWPAEDQAVAVESVSLSGGGCACNFAVDIRRLDPSISVETTGIVGNDEAGRFLAKVAADEGIGFSRVTRTNDQETQTTDAFQSRASGRRTHILFEGTAAILSPDHFDFAGVSARYFHVGLPGIHRVMDAPWGDDRNGWVSVLKQARAAGLQTNIELVSVAPEVLRDLALPCLPHLSTLVVNDYEIRALTGSETACAGDTGRHEMIDAAVAVLQKGQMELVVIHFPQGAVLADRDGTILFQPSIAVPTDSIGGANGAGDAFAAGFFYGRYNGWDPQRCLVMAHATAAACLAAPSTYESVQGWQDNMALVDRWGWRD